MKIFFYALTIADGAPLQRLLFKRIYYTQIKLVTGGYYIDPAPYLNRWAAARWSDSDRLSGDQIEATWKAGASDHVSQRVGANARETERLERWGKWGARGAEGSVQWWGRWSRSGGQLKQVGLWIGVYYGFEPKLLDSSRILLQVQLVLDLHFDIPTI